jgi:hypothetical protein
MIKQWLFINYSHKIKVIFANEAWTRTLALISLATSKRKGQKTNWTPQTRKRNSVSLLENAIEQLDSLDKITRLQQYGILMTNEACRGIGTEIGWITHVLNYWKRNWLPTIKGDKVILLNSFNKRLRQLNKFILQVLVKSET